VLWVCLLAAGSAGSSAAPANGNLEVECGETEMRVRVGGTGVVGVEVPGGWSALPQCQFAADGRGGWSLTLPLSEHMLCGTARVTHSSTGEHSHYQRVSVTTNSTATTMKAKCPPFSSHGHTVVRRDLPSNFVEPDYIEITSEVSGSAPSPVLGVRVRQADRLVSGTLNVAPGTELEMEVYLDDDSAGTYGILVSHLEVTDNRNKNEKKETIIFNGCTIDTSLFENFETKSGDLLTAKFRAFKFPESNYVLFRGTVDVCLDRCLGITCSDGSSGYGRRRRSVDQSAADPNKLYQVTMTTILSFVENATLPDALSL